MSDDFTTCAAAVRRLCAALDALEPRAASIGVPRPDSAEWYQLLMHKLRPQSSGSAPVVAAVVGGTNIGKSAVFNQLAGIDASAVSPLAAGTKHPVCLAPTTWATPAKLAPLFEGFTLSDWQASADALLEDDRDLLFWRHGDGLPERLLLLDTPDVDSDARVNWRRADVVRQTADVLIAILTQQKYNDAAVKQFFRNAAEADKAVIVVFNQVDLQLDRDVWPQWLAVFCNETGVRPLETFVVPYDRQAAQSRGLRFFRVGVDGRSFDPEPVDLRQELTELRYGELKARTLGGAVRRVLDSQVGVDRYLAEVRTSAGRFAAARRALGEAHRVGTSWPALPAGVLIDEIHRWWDDRRGPWTKKIHGFYRSAGQAIVKPIKQLWNRGAPEVDPLAKYADDERSVVLEGVDRLLGELDRLSHVGNDVLQPRLQRVLGGAARAEHIQRIRGQYDALPPIDEPFRRDLATRLETLERTNPRAMAAMRSLDTAAAVARPMVSVSLAVTGILLPGSTVFGTAMVTAAGHAAQEAVTLAAVTGGGEAVVSAAGVGLKSSSGLLFRQVQAEHAQRRAQQLSSLFEHELLGDLLAELEHGAATADGPEMREAIAAVADLKGTCGSQNDERGFAT